MNYDNNYNNNTHIKNNLINNILIKAKSLQGYNLEDLHNYLNISSPKSIIKSKGHTGQLIELLLGASATSKPIPDFPELGLEIKTLPIDNNHKVLETTYVCTAPVLSNLNNKNYKNNFIFEESVVYKKLNLVLWVPIIYNYKNKIQNSNIYTNRIIGQSFIWHPSIKELNLIKTDWIELTEMLILGQADKVSSHYGEVLQIRPKAANSNSITTSTDMEGNKIKTLPRGYYLRTSFTQRIYDGYNNKNNI